MENKKRGKLTGRIILGVVITLVLVYIVFLFVTTNFLGSNNIVTETAYKTTAYEDIKTSALVVRDEEYITSGTEGIMVYQAADGDKVTVDGVLAQGDREPKVPMECELAVRRLDGAQRIEGTHGRGKRR